MITVGGPRAGRHLRSRVVNDDAELLSGATRNRPPLAHLERRPPVQAHLACATAAILPAAERNNGQYHVGQSSCGQQVHVRMPCGIDLAVKLDTHAGPLADGADWLALLGFHHFVVLLWERHHDLTLWDSRLCRGEWGTRWRTQRV